MAGADSGPRFAPRRELGRTGFAVTALGIGDVADRAVPIESSVATVRRALEAGLNLVDTAPGYEDGYSEEIVGRALEGWPGPVFLVDKIDFHGEPVAPQVADSLRRLRRDAVDCFLFHGVSTMEGWERLAAPGGGMEQLAESVARGRARFRGISSHHPEVLLRAIESGLCDVVMFAGGPFCDARYIETVLPLARARGVGTIAFKAFGAGKLLGDTAGYGKPLKARPRGKVSSGGADAEGEPSLPRLGVDECVHYTLTCDPDVALLGMSFPNEQDAAFAAARSFVPLSPERMRDIRERAGQAVRGKGECWWNPPQ
jgi:aryl-alcohol dehydrogenase-like predicted oxidoreductase